MSSLDRRAKYYANRPRILARMKAYRAKNQAHITATIREWQKQAHALGCCVTCGQPHDNISQITKRLALRCKGCTKKQVDANKRRLEAKKKVAA